MSAPERDPVTGQHTTGHEWNGIKELDNPVPRIVFISLALGALYLIVSTILLPAWPSVSSYTRGILGVDQRTQVQEQVARARLERSEWTDRIVSNELTALTEDADIMSIVRETAPATFGDNCAGCHGIDGRGAQGYPNIVEAPLMWGEDIDALHETLRVGINSSHSQTRFASMLAFGRDDILQRHEIRLLVDYLETLGAEPTAMPELMLEQAQELFAFNCASCHGDDARGVTDFGAPDLTNRFWIYGGDRQSIFDSIYHGRAGHMPHWEGRLDEAWLRLLTLYVFDLREGAS